MCYGLLSVFHLCDIRYPLIFRCCVLDQCTVDNIVIILVEICAGQHSVFSSECWAKILSFRQASSAPPIVATTLVNHTLQNI